MTREVLLRLTPRKYVDSPADPRRPPAAGLVAAVGPLDLDHLGTEVGQQHRGVRRGEDPAEVGDPYAVQGTDAGHRKAASPVTAWPMTSVWISAVPS